CASCRRTEKNLFTAESAEVAEKAWPKDPRFQVSLRLCGDMTRFTCRFRELEPEERFPNRPVRVFIGIGKKYGEVHLMNRIPAVSFAILACLLTAAAAPLWAQNNPLSADVRSDYKSIRTYFTRAAEKMPEENYPFKPSPDVRSFAQQVAHVADDQY